MAMRQRPMTWKDCAIGTVVCLGLSVWLWIDLAKFEESNEPTKRLPRFIAALYEVGGKPLVAGVLVFIGGFWAMVGMILYWGEKDARSPRPQRTPRDPRRRW